MNEICGDEEVAGVARLGDDAEFVVESFLDFLGERAAVALDGAVGGELYEKVVLAGDACGKREGGDKVFFVKDNIDLVGDGERVLKDVGAALKVCGDFRGALKEEAAIVAHTLGVEPVFFEANAQQHVVRVVVLGLEKVRVVRGNDGEVQVLAQFEDQFVELLLFAGLVGLDFEVIAIFKDLGVPGGHGFGIVVAIVEQVLGDLTGHTGGGDDQAGVVASQQLAVYAGLAVEAFGVGKGREFDEILIAFSVAGEQNEVEIVLFALGGTGAVASVTAGDVGFHPNDGFELGLFGFFLEFPRGVQIAVIRDGEGRLFELLRAGDQVVNPVRAVEERVLGVGMEVDKAH